MMKRAGLLTLQRAWRVFFVLWLVVLGGWLGLWLNAGRDNSAQQGALTPEQCIVKLQRNRYKTYPPRYQLPAAITLLSWNIYKAARPGLVKDVVARGKSRNLLLLQEALDNKPLNSLKPFAYFAPGYASSHWRSGVTTLASKPAIGFCHYTNREPWLNTPKATNITEYVMADNKRLLVVNLHAINFTLGVSDYRRQIAAAVKVMAQHRGPIIFAGDMNTWSGARMAVLNKQLKPLQLTEVDLAPDQRRRVFGWPLDHLWVRGLRARSALSTADPNSDHNPIVATLGRR